MNPRRRRTAGVENVLKSPVRVRILGWLAGSATPRTQREVGRALSLSNASVHYHLRRLEEEGLAVLEGTRPGPNGITEKLYSGKAITQEDSSMNDREKSEFYLGYTLDSIREMHREAESLIKANWQANRFLVGCYGVHATERELRRFKCRLVRLMEQFTKSRQTPKRGTKPWSLTLGLVPSSGAAWGHTQKVFDMLS